MRSEIFTVAFNDLSIHQVDIFRTVLMKFSNKKHYRFFPALSICKAPNTATYDPHLPIEVGDGKGKEQIKAQCIRVR